MDALQRVSERVGQRQSHLGKSSWAVEGGTREGGGGGGTQNWSKTKTLSSQTWPRGAQTLPPPFCGITITHTYLARSSIGSRREREAGSSYYESNTVPSIGSARLKDASQSEKHLKRHFFSSRIKYLTIARDSEKGWSHSIKTGRIAASPRHRVV